MFQLFRALEIGPVLGPGRRGCMRGLGLAQDRRAQPRTRGNNRLIMFITFLQRDETCGNA
ncbi:hypothetical protein CBM2598_U10016 [Cupriavidus taiwanensis]|uniref:Uncharacterized protein n=1 Tax=Cupriavidus taiwanensis TaxID=164546 RepID=A0A7Z7JHM2_9BURK|nr:hypothetical protein CBM2597_U10025 [Cupriavidus taiwanensis]SOZ96187.1 hypothetical protein CBM2598_U10016 [Cupriavidus taiwanensis]SPC25530.1 hypothetical protein CBM2594_U10031 [Cupriavidus taiwanensis]